MNSTAKRLRKKDQSKDKYFSINIVLERREVSGKNSDITPNQTTVLNEIISRLMQKGVKALNMDLRGLHTIPF